MLFQSIKSKRTANFLNPKEILQQCVAKEGEIIADLGCGAGHFVFEASKLVGEKGRVFAVDIQKSVLSGIKSKEKFYGLHNVKLVWADLEKIGSTKISENSVDLAILSSTLHQTKNRENVLQEAKRMLKEDGRLVILDWGKEAALFGPPLNLRLNEKQLKKEIKEAGFKFAKDVITDQYHFGFLAIK